MKIKSVGNQVKFMSLSTVYKTSFALAIADALLAIAYAAIGNIHCFTFAILAGCMWAHGTWFKKKAEEKGE